MKRVTIGGDRLHSGSRMKAEMHGYERSTHDLSKVWKSSMASGTLVPFLHEIGLPGDTFDIELDADVLTLPTIGPLFGSYTLNVDIFEAAIRLYNSRLQYNELGVGLDMSKIALPQVQIEANGRLNPALPPDNQQINPSCIFSYFNIRGIGHLANAEENTVVMRHFNATGWLAYWDTYLNYYANKQEEIGAVIHKDVNAGKMIFTAATISSRETSSPAALPIAPSDPQWGGIFYPETQVVIESTNVTTASQADQIQITIETNLATVTKTAAEMFNSVIIDIEAQAIYLSQPNPNLFPGLGSTPYLIWTLVTAVDGLGYLDTEPTITTFPLTNITDMRKLIQAHNSDVPFIISRLNAVPYGMSLVRKADDITVWPIQYAQEGLALKTYKADLLNNWLQTEWIDGANGIAQVTAVTVADDKFMLDELNLKQKIYNMLNRIALSGGSYYDWQEAVYDHNAVKQAMNPVYLGGLIRNVVFQEVISNAATEDQPLGTLAGRGKMGLKNKGGYVTCKVNEPSIIFGIASLTPNLDYSQGNKWDMSIKTMDDLHKPALDEIGFQDDINDQRAWWTTATTPAGVLTYTSAGKVPAWINYMTAINETRGNFAIQEQEMFMTLNRRYSRGYDGLNPTIADLTTYIDPTKFNNIFSNTRRDAQNFWVQIGVKNIVRRKMSAKIIPNL